VNTNLSDAQIIEFFHLAFLQVLPARLDRAHYVIKGGANLRYFFDSVRYSEDIDLDAVGIEPWKLGEKVDGALASSAMGVLLRSGRMAVEEVTRAKQTETTQRWKALVVVSGRQEPVRTRIEFSHRPTDSRRILEAVPDRVVAPYALRSPTMLHYTAEAAIEQKISALAQRSETQARDVFDLEMLLRQFRSVVEVGQVKSNTVEVAVERALELPIEAFRDQVRPFLDPQVAELYADDAAWKQMQALVAERLMGLR
jgi:predicted nucleotidyltransferase component of viral defense system